MNAQSWRVLRRAPFIEGERPHDDGERSEESQGAEEDIHVQRPSGAAPWAGRDDDVDGARIANLWVIQKWVVSSLRGSLQTQQRRAAERRARSRS